MKYHLIYPFLPPLIFILLNIYLIKGIDRTLIYQTVPIQYKNIHNKEKGIIYGGDRWALTFEFTSVENVKFERHYHGFLNRIYIRKYIKNLIHQKPYAVELYYNAQTYNPDKRNLFFNIAAGEKKGKFYYWDIINYIKYTYYILFILSYFGAIGWLLHLGQDKTEAFYFIGVIINVVLILAYLIL